MTQTKPIRILYAGGHSVSGRVWHRSLSEIILVKSATRADEAAARFREHRTEITLTDLRLRPIEGRTALTATRKNVSACVCQHFESGRPVENFRRKKADLEVFSAPKEL